MIDGGMASGFVKPSYNPQKGWRFETSAFCGVFTIVAEAGLERATSRL